jgi:hypothetical protein
VIVGVKVSSEVDDIISQFSVTKCIWDVRTMDLEAAVSVLFMADIQVSRLTDPKKGVVSLPRL